MTRKEFYEKLSEDLKARIRACESEEEMMKVLRKENIELDFDVLENVSGGFAGGGGSCVTIGDGC